MLLKTVISLVFLVLAAGISAAQDSLADIIEACEKSVVRIETKAADGDSLGSGFVVDAKGTIITNCHVLAGATEAKVHFADGTTGDIVGTLLIDQARDIIVARISLAGKPVVPMASTLPRKGELVVALGSPHGLSFTATRGIISAIRSTAEMRSDVGDKSLDGTWIQVDAALSPGNSGGPLVNERGQVVAMSTLASRGSAQNLNFGISAADIQSDIGLSKGNPIVPLRVGVGKIKSKDSESQPGGGPRGGGPGGNIIQHETASAAVIQKYVSECKDAFSYLTRDLHKEAARLSAKMKEMKSGETYIPPNVPDEDADIVRVQVPMRKTVKWYFRSEAVKTRELARQESRIREVNKLKGEIKSVTDIKSLFMLAWNFGPKLDPRRNNTIGFMSDAVVLHAFNEHDVLIVYEDTPYLLWTESTAGLTLGEQVMPCPVYVNGTATAATRGGSSTSVTVLQTISQDELKNVMRPPATSTASNNAGSTAGAGTSGSSASTNTVGADGYRIWNDQTGNHSVEAILLSSDAEKVRLKKRDGKVIEIPIKTLCDADVKYLKGS